MAQLKKRGILALVHEASYRFLIFRLLSAKEGFRFMIMLGIYSSVKFNFKKNLFKYLF